MLLAFILLAEPGYARADPPTTEPATSQPRNTLRPFQPGVWIDWPGRAVHVEGRVVLRAGALEFLACWAGKEHESIVRCAGAAAHVYQALGLIGLTPGHPPHWDEESQTCTPPTGDLVDIAFEWTADGRPCSADAFDWLREVEYGRRPLPRPWVFAGSVRLPDGTLAADASGAGVALVDFPDSLLCLSRGHSSAGPELWVAADSAAIPPVDTPVRMALRPAAARSYEVRLDFLGTIRIAGRYCAADELADLLLLNRQLDPAYEQEIVTQRTLRSDVRHVRDSLRRAGLPPEAVRFTPVPVRPRDD